MTYTVQYIRNNEVIAVEDHDEHPSEDYLRQMVEKFEADFADVSRKEEDV